MDIDLNVELVADIQAIRDHSWSGTPVLVQLQACSTCANNILQRVLSCVIPLPSKRKIHRQTIRRRKHRLHVERARRARRSICPRARTRPAPDHCRRTRRERLRDLLWAYVMYMRVNGACCNDELLACDDLC